MKVYISLPISERQKAGRMNEVILQAEAAADFLRSQGHEPVSPLELHPDQERTYGQFVGRDIEVLIDECDAVYFCEGWEASEGCQLEWYASLIYRKEILYEKVFFGAVLRHQAEDNYLFRFFKEQIARKRVRHDT